MQYWHPKSRWSSVSISQPRLERPYKLGHLLYVIQSLDSHPQNSILIQPDGCTMGPQRRSGLLLSTHPSPMSVMTQHSSPSTKSPFSWDMQSSSMIHFSCFQYISDRLARCKLHVIFILCPSNPLFITACPMSRAAECQVIRICRRACELFPTSPGWVARIGSKSASRQFLSQLESQPSDSYLIRRSLIQHEILFSGEGLTLLSADHIHTFKRQLSALSAIQFTDTDYTRRLDSCVHLLRRINNTYRGVTLSQTYLERAYGTVLHHSTLREVCKAYDRNFGQMGVRGISVEAEIEVPRLPELESPTDGRPTQLLPELESPTVGQHPYLLPELESPTSQKPMGIPSALDASTGEAGPACVSTAEIPEDEFCDADMGSPCDYLNIGVTYPRVPSLSKLPGPSSVLSQPSLDTISTTICSRCLASMRPEVVDCGQEMQMLMGPEWEDFRRIGLGIMRC